MHCFSSSTKQDANTIKPQGLYFTGLTSGFDRLWIPDGHWTLLGNKSLFEGMKKQQHLKWQVYKQKGKRKRKVYWKNNINLLLLWKPLQTLDNRAPEITTQTSPLCGFGLMHSFIYMNNLYFALKKSTTIQLVKKQTILTYFDACFWFLLREQVILFGLGSKASSKGIHPFPHAIVYWISHIHNHLKEGCAIYDIVTHEENLP